MSLGERGLVLGLVATCWFASGCGPVPLMTPSEVSFQQRQQPTVDHAVLEAARKQRWATRRLSAESLELTFVSGKHRAVVIVVFDTDSFVVTYAGSKNLAYTVRDGRPLIHRSYNKWVQRLVAAIQDELAGSPRSQPSPPPPIPTEPETFVSYGTCFAVSSDGLVVTANHVIEGARSILLTFNDDSQAYASPVAASSTLDLALLRVAIPTPNYAPIAPPDAMALGDIVFTIGYPNPEVLGTEPKYTEGHLSALSGLGDDRAVLQTTVPIQPGNSGGPLANFKGEVVGVVSSGLDDLLALRITGALPQGVNYATKAELLRTLSPELPAAEPGPTEDRSAAIQRVLQAVCRVEAKP